MHAPLTATRTAYLTLLSLTLSACFHPPYNDFQKDPPPVKRAIAGASVGAVSGALIGGNAITALMGGAIGGTIGTANEIYHANKPAIISDLQKNDIQYIQYGDTHVLIVPTDHYFQFNSPRLNDICFEGLNNIIRLLQLYPCSTIYVAAFTDNIGARAHQRQLSQAQAEAMLTFLWAHNIPAKKLQAEGYGAEHDIGDNRLIHASAFNRRIEIQWIDEPPETSKKAPLEGGMK